MGISVSAGTAVILVGMFVALGVAVPGALNAYERVADAEDAREQLTFDRMHADIQITDLELDGDELTVHVVNEGSVTLSISETTILVDNQYQPEPESVANGDAGTDLWQPGETATFTVTADDPEVVVVGTEHGIRDRGEL